MFLLEIFTEEHLFIGAKLSLIKIILY